MKELNAIIQRQAGFGSRNIKMLEPSLSSPQKKRDRKQRNQSKISRVSERNSSAGRPISTHQRSFLDQSGIEDRNKSFYVDLSPLEERRGIQGAKKIEEIEEKMRRYKRKAKEYRARLRVIEDQKGKEKEVSLLQERIQHLQRENGMIKSDLYSLITEAKCIFQRNQLIERRVAILENENQLLKQRDKLLGKKSRRIPQEVNETTPSKEYSLKSENSEESRPLQIQQKEEERKEKNGKTPTEWKQKLENLKAQLQISQAEVTNLKQSLLIKEASLESWKTLAFNAHGHQSEL